MPSEWPRRFCCDEDLALIGYDGRFAADELKSWRSRGPGRGCGTSVLVSAPFTPPLLEAGATSAVDVDASREYLATAHAEAERRGLAGRVDYRYGDVVELAADLPPADIVTLDSVICCYPNLGALLEAALVSRPRLVGFVYPRDVWWMRAHMRLFNIMHSLRRSPARYFIHRRQQVRGLMADAGYAEIRDGGSPGWRVALYRSNDGHCSQRSLTARPWCRVGAFEDGLALRIGVFRRVVAAANSH
jgi:hypothetical protein